MVPQGEGLPCKGIQIAWWDPSLKVLSYCRVPGSLSCRLRYSRRKPERIFRKAWLEDKVKRNSAVRNFFFTRLQKSRVRKDEVAVWGKKKEEGNERRVLSVRDQTG